jgi:hypothetical protein
MKGDGFPRAVRVGAAKDKPAPRVMKKDLQTSTRIPFEQIKRIITPPGGKFTELQASGQAQLWLSRPEVFRTPPDAIREFLRSGFLEPYWMSAKIQRTSSALSYHTIDARCRKKRQFHGK